MDVDGRYRLASSTVTVTTAPAWHLDADPDEFATIAAAVTAALEGSCTVLATLVVQTPGTRPDCLRVAHRARMAARHEDRRRAGRRTAVRGQVSARRSRVPRPVPPGPVLTG
ncbi:hypothetical protein [Streptomyces sp. NPDC054834]